MLHDNGVNVIVAQPPINQASADALHHKFTDGFRDYMQDVAFRYPDMEVISEIPVYDNKLFGDSIHVNRHGAEVYTEELKKYMESIDFWGE